MQTSTYQPTGSAGTCSTLVDLLTYRSQHQPNTIAYTFLEDGETLEANLTFAQLAQQAQTIGATLQRLQATGERVLLLYPSGLDYIAAYFGCLYAGAIAVPMYPPHLRRTTDRLHTIVDDAQATVALTTSDLLPNLKLWSAQFPSCSALHWLSTDTIAETADTSWQTPAIDSDTIAFLQYSSGSTATPKGVMVSHGNILHNQQLLKHAYEHTDQTVYVSWLPLYHDMGLIGNILQSLYLGCRCVFMSPTAFLQRPARWLQAISRYRATTSGGPNFAYDLCIRKVTAQQCAGLDLSSWDLAFNGAEPIRAETLDAFVHRFGLYGFRRETFYPGYGLAEATLIVSGGQKSHPPVLKTIDKTALTQNRVVVTHPGARDSQTLVSAGKALLDQRIVIVDPLTHIPCAPEQIGEIWIAGPSVAQGYWNRTRPTHITFRAHLADTNDGPFLRTGDLGFIHQGDLFITGRSKDVIIIRGHNHYPQDIELTVEQSHTILRPNCGAAFSIEVDGEERVVVVQEIERSAQSAYRKQLGKSANLDVTRAIRRAVTEAHGVQVHAIVLLRTGSLPKTSSGKIQRHACKTAFLAGNLNLIAEWHALPISPVPAQPNQIVSLQSRCHRLRKRRSPQHISPSHSTRTTALSKLAA